MSDTPRTDAVSAWLTTGHGMSDEFVPAEFARGLERELAAFRAFVESATDAEGDEAYEIRLTAAELLKKFPC